MTQLAEKQCVPCRGGVPPLSREEIARLQVELDGWEVVENHRLMKAWTFKDFASALAWVNEVGRIAEEEQHHPDISLSWGRVQIEIWTHAINGLTESDFILAAKIDRHTKTAAPSAGAA